MAINQEHVVLIETKSTLGIDDVKDHIEKKVLGAVARLSHKKDLEIYEKVKDNIKLMKLKKESNRGQYITLF